MSLDRAKSGRKDHLSPPHVSRCRLSLIHRSTPRYRLWRSCHAERRAVCRPDIRAYYDWLLRASSPSLCIRITTVRSMLRGAEHHRTVQLLTPRTRESRNVAPPGTERVPGRLCIHRCLALLSDRVIPAVWAGALSVAGGHDLTTAAALRLPAAAYALAHGAEHALRAGAAVRLASVICDLRYVEAKAECGRADMPMTLAFAVSSAGPSRERKQPINRTQCFVRTPQRPLCSNWSKD